MYYRAYLQQMLSRGTIADRVAFAARLSASMGAIYAAGQALDVDFRNWYVPTGWEFTGGPWIGVGKTIHSAIFGRGIEGDLARYKVQKWSPTELEWAQIMGANVPVPELAPKVPQVAYPGMMVTHDVMDALDLLTDGDTGEAILRLMNVKKSR
jgi:hypothetical protein